MSKLKLVLYKDNLTPRSFSISTRIVYKTFLFILICAFVFIAGLALSIRSFISGKAISTQSNLPIASSSDTETGPTNNPEAMIQFLKDQVDKLNSQLKNANIVANTSKEIDKKNPALALFSPVVIDKTPSQSQVRIDKITYSLGNQKSPTTLTFELHNAKPDQSTEKGYIVVLAKDENYLHAYPNVFNNNSSPYLLDFERGETFQVARFRMVNAQFQSPAKFFQILIFTRSGELLINTQFEAK